MSGRLSIENYRGARVPRVLGLLLALAAIVATVAEAGGAGRAAWASLAGSLLVFAAGLVDDLAGARPRGIRNHLRALVDLRVTTGIVKLLVTVGAAVVVVALQPRRDVPAELAGVVLLAASANVWNGLDVRPGRAVKAFVPVAAVYTALAPNPGLAPVVLGLLAGAVLALPFDLSERAMLGDAGANLLGFAAGLGLYLILPAWAVFVSAGVAVALNVVGEVVTLSRVIDAVPPFRWVDRVGRRRDDG